MCCVCPILAQQQAQQEPPKPEPVKTSITVTEKISAEAPANISVMDSKQLAETPGVNLDDRLRQTPGFSLFRRSSSLVANPTTQGISLRGIGSSGASRTLVLWDGIPVNDPFGGWIYWTQFTPDEISSVEISRGAATSIFGDRAMSGAIGIFSRPAQRFHLFSGFEAGNQDSQDAWTGFSNAWSEFAVSGSLRAFQTDGYYIVPESIRGSADTQAGVRFVTGDVHLDHYSRIGNLYLKVDMLAEERHNGTVLTHNSTGLGTVSLRYDREFAHDSISILGFHTREGFHSTFSSVTNNRNTERLTYSQTVPSDATGGAALWQHHESRWDLLGGADVDRMGGTDTDHLNPVGLRIAGGTQLQHGVFGQADATLGPAKFFAGLRHTFAGGDNTFLSPNAGFVVGRKRLRLRGSVYRAFRAPTLNELYREFRVGNTDTLANPNLRPETVFGAEFGADWVGENTSARVTAYRNSLSNLITNVTLSSTPAAIVRQRANAADALSRGVEADFHRSWHDLSGDAQYLFVDSRYVTGFRVAQIPKHQGSALLTWLHGGTMATAGVRSFDYQFDDDLNQFRLPGYAVVQLIARQHVWRSLSADMGIENALNRVFYTAFTPTPNTGAPRLWRVGLRWDGKVH